MTQQLGIKTINIDFSDFSNQIYVQTIFVQKFLLGSGIEYKRLKINSKTTQNIQPVFDNGDYGSLFGYLRYDSLDNKYFPKNGWYLSSDFQFYGYSSNKIKNFNNFSVLKGDIGFAKTFLKKLSFNFQNETGFTMGSKSDPFFNFILANYIIWVIFVQKSLKDTPRSTKR